MGFETSKSFLNGPNLALFQMASTIDGVNVELIGTLIQHDTGTIDQMGPHIPHMAQIWVPNLSFETACSKFSRGTANVWMAEARLFTK